MKNRITSLIISIILSSASFNIIAKDGGSCGFVEETTLVQIKAISEGDYVLSTSGNMKTKEEDTLERLFYLSINKVKTSISRSDYLLATIEHSTSGACSPEKVINLEKLTIGKLHLTIDETLYYGGAFRINEVQNCHSEKIPACEALPKPSSSHITQNQVTPRKKFSDTEMKTIQDLAAQSLSACSLNAIRENSDKLAALSATDYSIGCAFNKSKSEEFVLYFKMINQRLEFSGVLL
jgi:hypothetical protein